MTELGSYSIRKGAGTYRFTALHPAQTLVSVCLRVGWTLDRAKERYLKYEKAGDELAVRTFTGIPSISGVFGVSQCYFNSNTNLNFIKKLSNYIFPKKDVKAINIICSMVVCLIFHKEWIKCNISNDTIVG